MKKYSTVVLLCLLNALNMDRENIDPLVQQVTIINGIITILRELVDFSSSESDDDEAEYAMHVAERRKKLPRLENYVENIVPAYDNQQFKSHFR